MHRRCLFIIVQGALCALLLATPAHAESTVLSSKKPYWTVGVRDEKLSRACSLGQFNLRRTDRLVARFTGSEGAEVLAVGRGSGNNLLDPKHLAKPTEDYFFRNQNTTSCEVYVGGRAAKPSN